MKPTLLMERKRGQDVLGQRVINPHIEGESFGHLGVNGQGIHPGVWYHCAVPADRAGEAPWTVLPAVQGAQALLAKGVQTFQQHRGSPVQVKVIVTNLALILLIGQGQI
ncbi:hypothetical protein FKM82_021167 [Ascaphus truei]